MCEIVLKSFHLIPGLMRICFINIQRWEEEGETPGGNDRKNWRAWWALTSVGASPYVWAHLVSIFFTRLSARKRTSLLPKTLSQLSLRCNSGPKVTTLHLQHIIYSTNTTNHCHTHHVSNLEVPVREDYSVGRRSNRQHEGERGTQSTRHHDVQWIDSNGLRLQ